ncbi:MAG: hypothetical protein K8R59_17385 [Thermoanaerobaculales bacterium]|nr:hypothetical protein [Thermoanaerobaculales bacterium]
MGKSGGDSTYTTEWPDWLQGIIQPWLRDSAGRSNALQDDLWSQFMPNSSWVDDNDPSNAGKPPDQQNVTKGSSDPLLNDDPIDLDVESPGGAFAGETSGGGGSSRGGARSGEGRASDDGLDWQQIFVDPGHPHQNPNNPYLTGDGSSSIGADNPWWFGEDGEWAPSEEGILGDNSRQIVGTGPLAELAARESMQVGSRPGEYGDVSEILAAMEGIAGERVSGDQIDDDPAILAAQERFDSAIMPMIDSQSALAGLNRSTARTNAASAQKAQTMLPLIQDAIGREERGIDRRLSTAGTRAQGYMGLGDRTQQRKRDSITDLMAMENYGRGIRQERSDSRYDDWARRATMFENSMGGPMSLLSGSAGSSTSRDKK